MAAGKEIKRLRELSKLTADEAAGLIGVGVGKMRKWEERDRDPSDTGDIQAVEAYFGCSLEKLSEIKTFDFVATSRGTKDYKDKYIQSLEEQNQFLKDQLNSVTSQLRHVMLLTNAIAETNQDSLAQMMEKLKIGSVSEVTGRHRKANLVSYSKMKNDLGIV